MMASQKFACLTKSGYFLPAKINWQECWDAGLFGSGWGYNEGLRIHFGLTEKSVAGSDKNDFLEVFIST